MNKRLYRWIGGFLALVAVYAAAGYLYLPYWLKENLPRYTQEYTHGTLTLSDVRFDPFLLALEIDQLDFSAQGPIFSVQQLKVDASIQSLWKLGAVVERIELDRPKFQLAVQQDGKTNLSDLVKPSKTPADSNSKPAKFWLHRVSIKHGELITEIDHANGKQTHHAHDITFNLTDLSNAGEKDASYAVNAELPDGTQIELGGDWQRESKQLTSNIAISQLPLASVIDIARLPLEVSSGTLAAQLDISVSLKQKQTEWTVNDGTFSASNIDLIDTHSDTQLALESLAIAGLRADSSQYVELGSISAIAAKAQFTRDNQGVLVIPPLGNTSAGEPTDTNASSDSQTTTTTTAEVNNEAPETALKDNPPTKPQWEINIKTVALKNIQVDLNDQAANAQHTLVMESVNAGPWNNVSAKLATVFNANGNYQQNTQWQIKGELTQQRVDADVQLTSLLLAPFSAYAPKSFTGELTSGSLSTTARAECQLKPKISCKLQGDSRLSELALNSQDSSEPLASVAQITLDQWSVDSGEQSIAVENVKLVAPSLTVVRLADGNINLAQLVSKTEQPSEELPTVDSEPSKPWAITSNKIIIENAGFKYDDLATTPSTHLAVEKLNGNIIGLTSDKSASAKAEFKAVVNNTSTLSIKGKLNPFQPRKNTNMDISLRSFDLPVLSAYTLQVASRPIDKGKANLDMNYQVTDTQLIMVNHMLFDQIKLGNHVENKAYGTMPLGLAITLLKDSKGQVDIHLPVEGDIDAPVAQYGHLVWKAFGGLIVGIVKSPFSLLGKLVGLGGDELSMVEFAPGSGVLSDKEKQQLSKLALALQQRPNIKLQLRPAYSDIDKQPLRIAKLLSVFNQQTQQNLTVWPNKAPEQAAEQKVFIQFYETQAGKPKLDALIKELSKDGKPASDQQLASHVIKRAAKLISVEESDLRKLASERGAAIKSFLAEENIKGDRLFELDIQGVEPLPHEQVPVEISLGK